jgi:hypothetical protein
MGIFLRRKTLTIYAKIHQKTITAFLCYIFLRVYI